MPMVLPSIIKTVLDNLGKPFNMFEFYLQSLICMLNHSGPFIKDYEDDCIKIIEKLLTSYDDEYKGLGIHFCYVLIKVLKNFNQKGCADKAKNFISYI